MGENRIIVLDINTANKIAAGEVVERPASIVKELVENAIDAESHRIEIEIMDGGISYIRVTDDGVGMTPEDALLAIKRHATSKIRDVEDLTHIATLGFRGEALPSIASVSRFSLTTRIVENELGTYVEIQGGELVDNRPAGAGVGTTIVVKDLFYNTPARQKFLKTPAGESTKIHDLFGRLALSHPEVAFKLINNGRQVLATPGTGKMEDVLTGLYGTKIVPDLIPVDHQDENCRISGVISTPTLLKSSRLWQTYLVNRRVINSRLIAKAVDTAYHSLLPKGGYPLAVLEIILPPERIDVNVHPQKSEIKFSDEQAIYRSVYKAVLKVLDHPEDTRTMGAEVETPRFGVMAMPSFGKSEPNWQSSYQPAANPLWRDDHAAFSVVRERLQEADHAPFDDMPTIPNVSSEVPMELPFRPIGQVADCFIVAQDADGLFLIDQHAAHERILYDRLTATVGRVPVQQLLVPVFYDFDAKEMQLLTENGQIFYELGLTLESMGPATMRLTELPADMELSEIPELIREILTQIQNQQDPTPQALRHACMQTAACRAAIKAGQPLTMRQITALLTELQHTALPYTCPHGRPTVIRFGRDDLAKMFKRT